MSTAHGWLQLALFAPLAEYERELINERVKAGMIAAKERGVKFGEQPPKLSTIETRVRLARRFISEEGPQTAEDAAERVGLSRATLYRYLKQYGAENAAPPTAGEAVTRPSRGHSLYGTAGPCPPGSDSPGAAS